MFTFFFMMIISSAGGHARAASRGPGTKKALKIITTCAYFLCEMFSLADSR